MGSGRVKEPAGGRPDASAFAAEVRSRSGTAAARAVLGDAGPRTVAEAAAVENEVASGRVELSPRVAPREVSGDTGAPVSDNGDAAEGPPTGLSARCTGGEHGDTGPRET